PASAGSQTASSDEINSSGDAPMQAKALDMASVLGISPNSTGTQNSASKAAASASKSPTSSASKSPASASKSPTGASKDTPRITASPNSATQPAGGSQPAQGASVPSSNLPSTNEDDLAGLLTPTATPAATPTAMMPVDTTVGASATSAGTPIDSAAEDDLAF